MKKTFLAAALTISIFLVILLTVSAIISPPKVSAIISRLDETSQTDQTHTQVTFTQRTADIAILGPDGFDRSGYTSHVNHEITFQNLNTKEYPDKQTVVIMIQNDNDQFDFINSPKIRFNQSWTTSFQEPAEYTLWAVGHDIEIPLTIRE